MAMTPSKWILAGALAAAAATTTPASAQSAEAMRQEIEARMHVSGSIDIEPDGTVSAHAIEDAADVPREVRALIDEAAATWRFEPIVEDGVAVPARARMHVKVVAEQVPGGESVRLRLDSAHFGKAPGEADGEIRPARTVAPRYPEDALHAGASATVYLSLKLDAEGAVADQFVERVDLYRAATGARMAEWREAFADAALRSATRWRYTLAGSAAECAREGTLTVRVPVDFTVNGQPEQDGPWEAYIPGPERTAPWLDASGGAASPDTFAGNDAVPADPGRRLLTPLDPRG
jgi:hypothetical protein